MNKLDEILTIVAEHVDFVGLGNLGRRVSMGLPGFCREEPEWVQAMGTLRPLQRRMINLTKVWLSVTMNG